MAITKEKHFLITGEGGEWATGPVEANSPEEAVLKTEQFDSAEEASQAVKYANKWEVYELASPTPTSLEATLALTPRS